MSVVCGHNTISVLWGKHSILCEVEWQRFVALSEYS